jgi:exodeoxyribonuclease V alpha subunit
MDEYGNIIGAPGGAGAAADDVYGDDVHEVEGFVEHIVFRNEENGFTIFTIVYKGKEVTCLGTFGSLNEGEYLVARGGYETHPVYWKRFKVRTYTLKLPEDEQSIRRYLGSGAIKGIGAKTAENIVNYFGVDAFRIMEEEPERLAEVKGISIRRAMEIAGQVAGQRDMRKAMMFLQQYGISMGMSSKIYEQYGEQIYSILQENPYKLADDINGIGFRMADEIATRAGIRADSEFRIKSGILYALGQAAMNGHTYLPMDRLCADVGQLLLIDLPDMSVYIQELAMERKVVARDGNVYLAMYYYMELKSAKKLSDLNMTYDVDLAEAGKELSRIEDMEGITLESLQRDAVMGALGNGVVVITGGPGTGKTTIINTIIRYFEGEGLDIRLAAPTGRAAKRMSETTGCEAQTIHRLLEVNGGSMDGEGGTVHFERNALNPLETDVLIIDEMSMVDISLMSALLDALLEGTRLVLVGDVDQLPSVGPGSVLKDIIGSGRFKVVKLTKIFRQSDESEIVTNAHAINNGEDIILNKYSKDFLFIHRETPEDIVRALCTVLREKLPGYIHCSVQEVQVLTPMRKGLVGVEQLNRVLQSYVNPDGQEEKEFFGTMYREGDKVMQIKNDYQMGWEKRNAHGFPYEKGSGVYNGDMGIIEEISTFSQEVHVRFDDDRHVSYQFSQMDELELAYAITIHKSQGSEYPAVIIPMFPGPRMLMTRNLLYTAVTRAKSCVCLIGREECFREMIRNLNEQKRYSSLGVRINEL